MNTSLCCPIDGKDDSIQKVSSIALGGISTSNFSGPSVGLTYSGGWGIYGGYSFLNGKSVTDLARYLSCPPVPKKRRLSFGEILALDIILFFASALVASLFQAGTDPTVGGLWAVILLFVLVALVWYINAWVSSIKHKKEMAHYNSVVLAKWNQLYYCWKHGVVFDPATGETCSPVETKNFCYR